MFKSIILYTTDSGLTTIRRQAFYVFTLLQRMILAFCRSHGISEKVIGEKNVNHALSESIRKIYSNTFQKQQKI